MYEDLVMRVVSSLCSSCGCKCHGCRTACCEASQRAECEPGVTWCPCGALGPDPPAVGHWCEAPQSKLIKSSIIAFSLA